MQWIPPNSEYPPPKASEPPLHRAARIGDCASIKALAAGGADVNEWFDMALDPGGRDWIATPLMVAAGSGYGASAETMQLLLDYGANPSLKGEAGTCAFFAAAGLGWNYPPGGDAKRLALALDLGCDPNEKDSRDICLLAAAAATGDSERIHVLLTRGANPNPVWDQEAADRQYDANVRHFGDSFANFMPTPQAPMHFQIPLFEAVISNSFDCVKRLIDAGADPLQTDDGQRNALYFARSPEVAKLLTSAGVDIEACDQFEWTPLQHAVKESIDHVRALLAAGADPNATSDHGYTIFMAAAGSMERSVEVLTALIEGGADPFAISEFGYNALHAAVDVNGEANAEASVRSILTYLVDLGINLNQRNNLGETPLDRARNCGTELEFRILQELIKRKQICK